VKRYDVRQAQLDPTVGSEIAKTRPVVIVSLDVFNEMLETVTVCPLTSALRPTWRTRPAVRIARKPAELAGHCSERRILTGKLFGEQRARAAGSTASNGAATAATTPARIVAVILVAHTRC